MEVPDFVVVEVPDFPVGSVAVAVDSAAAGLPASGEWIADTVTAGIRTVIAVTELFRSDKR